MSIVKKLFKPLLTNQPHGLATSIYRKDPIANLFRDFDSFPLSVLNDSSSLVPVDVKESDKEYELVADIPGFSKNEINCLIDEDKHLLTLKGEKKQSKEENEGNYIIKERYYNTFTRQFDIPSNVKLDQIKAQLKDGQFKLTLPKSDEKLPEKENVKNIEIGE